MKRIICMVAALMILLSAFAMMNVAAAGSVSVNLSASPSSVRSGDTVTLSVNLKGVSGAGGVAAGTVVVSYDSSKLAFQSAAIGMGKPAADLDANNSGGKVNLLYLDNKGGSNGFSSDGAMATITFKVNNTEPGSVSFSASASGFGDKTATGISATASGTSLTIAPPLAGNNSLSALTVSNATISPEFNKDTINYTTTVPFTVEKLDVKATAEDVGAKAAVSSPTLKAGANTNVTVTVTAANGSKKTYTIKVMREQDPDYDMKVNNNLATLTVANATLSPVFDKATTSYTAEVPFDVEKLEIQATAEIAEAKVAVNSPELAVNAATNVTVVVTSVSGAKKTYTIKTTRGQDPNFTGSAENTLSTLAVEGFLLSPVFDPAVTEYIVWLPYETESLKINAVPVDEKANIEISGGETLEAGQDNTVTVTCIAESGSRKQYTIIAKRAPAHGEEGNNQGTILSTPTNNKNDKKSSGIPILLGIVMIIGGIALGFATGFILRKPAPKYAMPQYAAPQYETPKSEPLTYDESRFSDKDE